MNDRAKERALEKQDLADLGVIAQGIKDGIYSDTELASLRSVSKDLVARARELEKTDKSIAGQKNSVDDQQIFSKLGALLVLTGKKFVNDAEFAKVINRFAFENGLNVEPKRGWAIVGVKRDLDPNCSYRVTVDGNLCAIELHSKCITLFQNTRNVEDLPVMGPLWKPNFFS